MIYLDYSATTKTNDEVLDTFVKCSKEFIGNPNSLHKLGVNSKNIIDSATNQISKILNITPNEIIYTSGSTESNNLAILGICLKYKSRGMNIITTKLEHSSVYGPINYLEKNGFNIKYVKLDKNGQVDLEDLENIMSDDTILVSINLVNSEIGIMQDIDKVANIVHKYAKCFLHSDITQAIGKVNINLKNIDLASFSAHKFFGIKGIGALIKKEKIDIQPIIMGGKSTTIYRSGTPTLPLIVSMSKALRLSFESLNEKEKYVKELNEYLKLNLEKFDRVKINSNSKCIPHILNVSILGVKPETFQHALEKYDIYISTKSACSDTNSKSDAVYALTNNDDLAKSSIRISISYLTTREEIDEFIKCFKICYDELTSLN